MKKSYSHINSIVVIDSLIAVVIYSLEEERRLKRIQSKGNEVKYDHLRIFDVNFSKRIDNAIIKLLNLE